METIRAVDLFCGCGGTSSGLVAACRALRPPRQLSLLAINHWPVAVETHRANHPFARHLCESLDSVDPRKAVPGGRLSILVASPECTHHSVARGGKPCSDQSRASAWHVLRWAEALRVENVLVENVPEFQTWGPLGTNGRPLKRRRGETYRAFLAALESLGYAVEARVLNAADFGAATSRRRLFILARKGGPVEWPAPTHAREGANGRTRWRAAREIINWPDKGTPLSERKRPLAPRTMARIAAGLRKFGGEAFLAVLRGPADEPDRFARTVEEPMPVCSAGGTHLGLAEPFIVPFFGERDSQPPRVHSTREPLPAVTSHGAGGLVEPFLAKYYGSGAGAVPVTAPAPTVTTKDRLALIEPVRRGARLDVRFRMLRPRELAAAMGFAAEYRFAGTQADQVRQIGNAVEVRIATALCLSALEGAA